MCGQLSMLGVWITHAVAAVVACTSAGSVQTPAARVPSRLLCRSGTVFRRAAVRRAPPGIRGSGPGTAQESTTVMSRPYGLDLRDMTGTYFKTYLLNRTLCALFTHLETLGPRG